MCGICGNYSYLEEQPDEVSLRKMMYIMKHRGPDDEGVFLDDHIALGFVRLSIIDLSDAGHQPMISPDGRYVMAFNGEIYNYIELKKDLESKGHCFMSRTDSEVLLHAYLQWGEECLDRLNGMWAFVIYDKKEQRLFGARDRYGIKPLYYFNNYQEFVFGSDINSIVGVRNNHISIDDQSVADYLVFNRTDHSTHTFYKEVSKIPHGAKFIVDKQGLRVSKWYNLQDRVSLVEPSVDRFKELFLDSLRLRMRSDVPVGVCLSGGLDSSSIVASLCEELGVQGLSTFSAVYNKGEIGDESEFINLFNQFPLEMHRVYPTAESLYNDAEQFIEAIAEPIPSTSPYAQYKVMELAKDHVVVTLDGQGADEYLAGYHYFYGYVFKEYLKGVKLLNLTHEMIRYAKLHQSAYGLMTLFFYLLPAGIQARIRKDRCPYISREFGAEYVATNRVTSTLYKADDLRQSLLNHFEYKLEHLLKWEDRNSMNFSLEARVPFLDYRLVEYGLSLQTDMVVKDGYTKYVLREAMKGVLPEKVRMRKDKVGFGTPQDMWFRTEIWKKRIHDTLHDSVLDSYIDRSRAANLFKRHLSGEINISKEIWKWYNLAIWINRIS